jgi:hypothetical protein
MRAKLSRTGFALGHRHHLFGSLAVTNVDGLLIVCTFAAIGLIATFALTLASIWIDPAALSAALGG